MIRLLMLIIGIFAIASCTHRTDVQVSERSVRSDSGKSTDESVQQIAEDRFSPEELTVHGIRYQVNCYSAADFLMKSGRKINASDAEALKKESVIQLTIADTATYKSVKEHPRLSLSEEEISSYLQQGILTDFTVIQGEEVLFPVGSQLESAGSTFKNTINLFLFFNDIDRTKELKIQYNDQLFGAGLIRFNTIIK